MTKAINYKKTAIIFAMGFTLLWSLFFIYPFITSFFMSFQTCKGSVCEFSGLHNIVRLLHDKVFWITFANTIIFLIQIPIMMILGLIFASLLNTPNLRCKNIYRTIIFIPCITSLVAYSIVFKMMFATDGMINSMLLSLHIINHSIDWLGDPISARLVIIFALIWRWTGYVMIFYLAGMQNIPKDIYEAAKIDGSNGVRTFFCITIPQIKPIIFFTAVTSTIGTMQLFDEVMNITNGGPGYATTTLSKYIYDVSFVTDINYGYAATLSYVIVLFVLIMAIIQKRMVGE